KNAFDNPSGKNANANTITVGTNGSKTIVVYLQGDQYIQLMGLKKGAHYEVTEDDYEPDGYVSTATSSTNTFTIGTGTDAKTFNAVTSGVIDDADVLTGYKNVKQGVIPTGVILSVAPWVIAGIVIIAGVVFFAIRSRKKYEE
ncbi:MAG: QVPTGV class sortase B protein-sorting domain-containing protein, partial [Lachnospiraceae bacterium]|nr:QVPTGV class sortase B protein-sorting domain-containing protein [Lachnospiraceae bacterium]